MRHSLKCNYYFFIPRVFLNIKNAQHISKHETRYNLLFKNIKCSKPKTVLSVSSDIQQKAIDFLLFSNAFVRESNILFGAYTNILNKVRKKQINKRRGKPKNQRKQQKPTWSISCIAFDKRTKREKNDLLNYKNLKREKSTLFFSLK